MIFGGHAFVNGVNLSMCLQNVCTESKKTFLERNAISNKLKLQNLNLPHSISGTGEQIYF